MHPLTELARQIRQQAADLLPSPATVVRSTELYALTCYWVDGASVPAMRAALAPLLTGCGPGGTDLPVLCEREYTVSGLAGALHSLGVARLRQLQRSEQADSGRDHPLLRALRTVPLPAPDLVTDGLVTNGGVSSDVTRAGAEQVRVLVALLEQRKDVLRLTPYRATLPDDPCDGLQVLRDSCLVALTDPVLLEQAEQLTSDRR